MIDGRALAVAGSSSTCSPIAVFGTGMVGQALAGKLSELGHEVTVGTRDVEATLARTEPGDLGNPPFAIWREAHQDVRLETAADAAVSELIVNATNGAGSIAMLESAGEENLAGKVLLDVANPLDFSQGRLAALAASLGRGRHRLLQHCSGTSTRLTEPLNSGSRRRDLWAFGFAGLGISALHLEIHGPPVTRAAPR